MAQVVKILLSGNKVLFILHNEYNGVVSLLHEAICLLAILCQCIVVILEGKFQEYLPFRI